MAVPDQPPLPPVFGPAAIKKLREDSRATRATFARGLNISTRTIGRWEVVTVRPSGPARQLLGVVQKHGFQLVADAQRGA
ncbi:helix-turn-helix domain-containing protein [Sphingobium sp. Z007]|nr:transcriptional regulator [Sphingobium sp. Z007]